MPNNIENRIVQMEFENAQFERGAKTTLSTLEKLDDALTFKGVEKGLDNLSAAVNKLDFSSLMTGIDSVSRSFSAMEAVSFGVFERIGEKITDLGMKIGNELFVAQKKAGFSEYEMELGSVQTINASTGKSFEEIYGYLAQLNKYADDTIYSFSDMTSSIGKFTNAGVDLDTAVKAIQGISNEAAVSGANAQEASRAMYNFAQALSSGAVKLIDWKSIENANMATVEFKEELMKTALELGTIKKEGDKFVSTTTDMQGKVSDAFTSTMGFNDSLSHQWMTTEVLTKTLGRYSDSTTELGKKAFAAAQDVKTFTQLIDTLKEAIGSGWGESFRIIIGEFEDAKKLWTGVANTLGGVVDAFSNLRNHALRYWKQEGGRTKLLNSLVRLWKIFDERVKIVGESFKNAFPIVNNLGHVLKSLTNQFTKFTKELKKGLLGNKDSLDDFRERVDNVFRGFRLLLKAIKIVAKTLKKVFSTAIKAVTEEIGELTPLAYTFERIAAFIFKAAKAFRKWAASSETLSAVSEITKKFYSIIQSVAGIFKSGFLGDTSKTFKNLKLVIGAAKDVLYSFATVAGIAVEAFVEGFSDSGMLVDIFSKIATFVSKAAKSFREWITDGDRLMYLKETFKGFVYFIQLIVEVAKQVGSALAPVFKQASTSEPVLLKITARIAGVIKQILEFVKETKIVERVVTKLLNTMKDLAPVFSGFKEGFSQIFKGNYVKGLKAIGEGFKDAFSNIIEGVLAFVKERKPLAESFGFFDVFQTITEKLAPIGEKFKAIMKGSFGNLGEFLSDAFSSGASVMKILGGIFTSTLDFIATTLTATFKAIKSVGNGIKNAFSKMIGFLKVDSVSLDGIFKVIGEGLQNAWLGLTKDPLQTFTTFETLTTFSDVLKNLTEPLKSISTVSDSISGVIDNTTGILGTLKDAADKWQKDKTAEMFRNIAVSLLIMAGAMALLAIAFKDNDTGAVAGIAAITGLLFEMSNVIINMSNSMPNPVAIGAVTTAMIKMGVAMILIGIAISKIVEAGEKNPENLSVALIMILSIMRTMATTIESISLSMPDPKMLKTASSAMIKMAIAMYIVGKAIKTVVNSAGGDLLTTITVMYGLMKMLSVMTDSLTGIATAAPNKKVLDASSKAMIKMSVALLLISLAIKGLVKSSEGNVAGLIISMYGISKIMTIMCDMMFKLTQNQLNPDAIKAATNSMFKLGVAVYIIAKGVASLAKAGKDGNVGGLTVAILGMVLIMNTLAKVTITLAKSAKELGDNGSKTNDQITSMILIMLGLAVAVSLLVPAVKKMGEMKLGDLAKGMMGLGAVLYLLFGFVRSMSELKINVQSLDSGLVTLAALIIALKVFAGIIIDFASVEPGKLAGAVEAFVVMAAVMYGLILGVSDIAKKVDPAKLLTTAGVMIAMTGAFSGMATAILILAIAVRSLAGFSFDELLPGLVALLALLGAITLIYVEMNKMGSGSKGMASLGLSLVIVAIGLKALVAVLLMLQGIDVTAMGNGLLGLAIIIGGIVLVSNYAAQLQAMAMAVIELGVASLLFGAGAVLAAASLVKLVEAIVLFADNWNKMKKALTSMIKFIPKIIPELVDAIIKGTILFFEALVKAVPKILVSLTSIFKDVFKAIMKALTTLINGLLKTLLETLKALAKYIKPLGEVLLKLMIDLLYVLDDHIDELLVILGKVVIKIILGLLDWIIEYIPTLAEKIFDAVVALIYAVAALFDDEHVDAFLEAARTLFNNLVNAIIKVVTEGADELIQVGPLIIGGILKGIAQSIGKVSTKIGKGLSKAAEAAKEKLKEFTKLGRKIVKQLVAGITEKWKEVSGKVKMFGESVAETLEDAFKISSPSKRMEEDGKYIDEGLANGISDNSDLATNAASGLAEGIGGSFDDVDYASIISDKLGDTSISPEVTPVLNLDSLSDSGDALTNAFSDKDSLIKDYTSDISFGSTSTKLSQETAESVNATMNDETKEMYEELKSAIKDLTEMIDGVVIVSDEAKLSTSLDVDGATLGSAVMPFVDVALAGGSNKSKNKVAYTYRKPKKK